jgi:hypothetical protein
MEIRKETSSPTLCWVSLPSCGRRTAGGTDCLVGTRFFLLLWHAPIECARRRSFDRCWQCTFASRLTHLSASLLLTLHRVNATAASNHYNELFQEG